MSEIHIDAYDTMERHAASILDGLGINDTDGEYAYAQKLVDWRSKFLSKSPSQAVLKSFETVVNRRLMQAQAKHSTITAEAVRRLAEWQEWLSARIKR